MAEDWRPPPDDDGKLAIIIFVVGIVVAAMLGLSQRGHDDHLQCSQGWDSYECVDR